MVAESDHERQLRAQVRKNITETLVSLRVNTVDDIQQITAVLAQCMVGQPGIASPASPRPCTALAVLACADAGSPTVSLWLLPSLSPQCSLASLQVGPGQKEQPKGMWGAT
jgi:hypothetical protein